MSCIQHTDALEATMAQFIAALNAEHNKGDNSNFQRVHELAYKILTILMRQSNRHDQYLIQKLRDRIKEDVTAIQKTHNKTSSVAVTVVSSALSIAFGVTGVAGAFLGAEDFMKIATSGVALGSGVGGLGKVFDDQAARERTSKQFKYDEDKRTREERDGGIRNNENRLGELLRGSKEAENGRHQAFQDAGR